MSKITTPGCPDPTCHNPDCLRLYHHFSADEVKEMIATLSCKCSRGIWDDRWFYPGMTCINCQTYAIPKNLPPDFPRGPR